MSVGLFGPRAGRSYPLRVTIVSETLPEDPDHEPGWYQVEKIEDAGPLRSHALFDAEEGWFRLSWDAIGIDVLGKDHGEFRRLVVVGTMWWRKYSRFDGDDYEEGFDVEKIEELVR